MYDEGNGAGILFTCFQEICCFDCEKQNFCLVMLSAVTLQYKSDV